MSRILDFYRNGQYFKNNPTWDSTDADWKYQRFAKKIEAHLPEEQGTVWEVGCGSGALLKRLASEMPKHKFYGWDIAPEAKQFWNHSYSNLNFEIGDVLETGMSRAADVIMLIDVLEHLADPTTFLERIRNKGKYVIIHLPLDLTVINLIFDQKLLNLRDSVGHIHYYTKSIAEKMLRESGYEVLVSEYSNAWKDSPNLRLLGRLGRVFRKVFNWFSPALNAKILGGETLILIAKPAASVVY